MLDVLATNNFGDTRSGGLAGPMGLFIILLLGVATVLLIRNMNSRLRRLPERFPGAEDDAAAGDSGPAATAGTADRAATTGDGGLAAGGGAVDPAGGRDVDPAAGGRDAAGGDRPGAVRG